MSDLTPKSGDSFVEIALPVPLRRTFTYTLPAKYKDQVQIGTRVVVPFGKRMLTGYVLERFTELPDDADVTTDKLRSVREVLDEAPLLTREIIELAKWTADYYLSFIGEILRATLPAGLSGKGERQFSISGKGRESLSGMLLP